MGVGSDIITAAGIHIFCVDAEGGTPRRLTSGEFFEAYPSWSRDSQWIYFVSIRGEERGWWKAPAGGIYVLDPFAAGGAALEFFPLGPGGHTAVLRLGGMPEDYFFAFDRIGLSADGRWIVYSYRDHHESDIMLTENFR